MINTVFWCLRSAYLHLLVYKRAYSIQRYICTCQTIIFHIVGVYLASNVGSQQAPFLLPFLASAATVPASIVLYNRRTIITMISVVVASLVSGYFSRWTTRKRPSNLIGYMKVIGFLGLALMSYGALWGSNIYHNTSVHTLNGTKVRTIIHNKPKDNLSNLWHFIYFIIVFIIVTGNIFHIYINFKCC